MSIIFNENTFKDPQSMTEIQEVYKKIDARSANNTLLTQSWDFPAKKRYQLEWILLTETETDELISYTRLGQIPVSSTILGHNWSFTLASVTLETDISHGHNGKRRSVILKVEEA